MDLAEAVDRVYGAELTDFVGVRDALARQARADGERELATSIKALRKPTRSAWLVNRWARAAPEEVDELAGLAELLAQAHRTLAPDDLRALTRQRNQLINAQTRKIAGGAVSAAIQAEIGQILTGALTDAALADRLRTGTVLQAVPASGFGTLDLGGDARVIPLRPRTERKAGGARRGRADDTADAQARAAEQARQRALAEAQEAADRVMAELAAARERAQEAAAELAAAEGAVAAADEAVEAAEAELTRARAGRKDAGRRRTRASDAADQASAAVASAEAAADDARATLERLAGRSD
ncbi:hypothetical protein [Naumannella huperziae]